jgi:hypothetical protein
MRAYGVWVPAGACHRAGNSRTRWRDDSEFVARAIRHDTVFNRGIALIGPNRAAPFFHLVPVFGSAMAILFLDEQPRLFHLVGYALVLAGVVIASRQASAG